MRLLGEPTLESERGNATSGALAGVCGTGILDIRSSLINEAVCSGRGPGALIACSTSVSLRCVRHVVRSGLGQFGMSKNIHRRRVTAYVRVGGRD
jgi:hypothetical protein